MGNTFKVSSRTKESINVNVIKDGQIINSVQVDKSMNIKSTYRKQWTLSRSDDKDIIDYVKSTGFVFFEPKKAVKVKKQTDNGIYITIGNQLHFYHRAMNSIVICTETGPGNFRYMFGSNLNAPQEREIINHINN